MLSTGPCREDSHSAVRGCVRLYSYPVHSCDAPKTPHGTQSPACVCSRRQVCYGGAGNVTYANAQALGRVQWEIVLELAKGVSSAEEAAAQLDVAQAERLLAERLEPLQTELQVDLATVSHAA